MKSVIDKLRTAVDNERIGASTVELLGMLSDVREWAEALTELADHIETAEAAVEDYAQAEGRDEKADAKEEAIIALGEMIESWDAVTALPDVDDLVTTP
jgi:glutamine synthetase adenylyltransferase